MEMTNGKSERPGNWDWNRLCARVGVKAFIRSSRFEGVDDGAGEIPVQCAVWLQILSKTPDPFDLPIGYKGGINLYEYVSNRPSVAVDSSGNSSQSQSPRSFLVSQ